MQLAPEKIDPGSDLHHPRLAEGQMIAVYVWQYPLRLVHWGLVICIGVLSFTGYYIHDPFIIGQIKWPFLMGWFRFVHESFGMIFAALFLTRMYLFFEGNRWERWRRYVPLKAEQWKEMVRVAKFYLFINPKAVSKIGHNALAAFSYVALYGLVFVEIITGLVMFNVLRHSAILTPLVGWIPSLISLPNIRLIHFFLMFVFISFGIFHVHLGMLISREEKHGLMDSIFIGYKVIPAGELAEDDEKAKREGE
ncbi:MAG TPA: Ni/Fe-hydrogenase, b-type cytochrome subunit [Bryobacteraceae bacterium]|jgi:Ni/Fe-hydrogenase 1 B-type cytochrome subunit|nr:Ni/Fe-hydrogenase, b-type cytochrome subunit [Bryobacteraceae bacterium]